MGFTFWIIDTYLPLRRLYKVAIGVLYLKVRHFGRSSPRSSRGPDMFLRNYVYSRPNETAFKHVTLNPPRKRAYKALIGFTFWKSDVASDPRVNDQSTPMYSIRVGLIAIGNCSRWKYTFGARISRWVGMGWFRRRFVYLFRYH